MSPYDSSMAGPQHLVVLVNGLWGWQRDWAQMKRALDAQNKDGRLLVHVSAVNVGAQTYAGIDTCGQRLAQEVLQLVSTTPSLTTISFLGHSMGGLIARYAVGLLTQPDSSSSSSSIDAGGDPGDSSGDGSGCKSDGNNSSGSSSRCWQLAGLKPCLYISIATPHLGCSSHHPEEAHWQDRPFMSWLAAAVAAGHLGGHEHLAPLPASVAAAAANAAPAAAAAAAGTPTPCTAGAGVQAALPKLSSHPSNQSRNSSASSSANCSTSGTSRISSSRYWPWTPCLSVVQLLGCDNWRPLPDMLQDSASGTTSSSSSSSSSSTAGRGSRGIAAQVPAQSEAESSSDCILLCQDSGAVPLDALAAAVDGQTESSSSSCCCVCKVPQLQFAWVSAERSRAAPADADSSSSSSSSSSGGSNTGGERSAAGAVHLLDVLCRDVRVSCQGCGACRMLRFLSGVEAFKQRLTYSSEGGDHLIPWCSSALLSPSQLPGRAAQQTVGLAGSSQQFQLPVLKVWATQPAIVEQPQQQQPARTQCTPSTAAAGLSDSPSAQLAAAAGRQDIGRAAAGAASASGGAAGSSSSDGETATFASAGAADGRQPGAARQVPSGQLQSRLKMLQGMPWRRLHVVWPRFFCLGSSHCNIQYNGPLNFAGQAVVNHLCQQILNAPAETAVPVPVTRM